MNSLGELILCLFFWAKHTSSCTTKCHKQYC